MIHCSAGHMLRPLSQGASMRSNEMHEVRSSQSRARSAIASLVPASPVRQPKGIVRDSRLQRSHHSFTISAAGKSGSPAGASSLLKLSIPFATEFGDSVAVTTSTSGWNIDEAVPLKWGEGDVWHGELPAESGPLFYKYVIRRGDDISEWQPGENLVVDVPSEPAVLYIQDRWLNEERSVQVQQSSGSSLQPAQPAGGEPAQPAPTATDKAAKATAAAAASSPAAATQQPTAAEPESEDAAVAAQRGNSLGKPLAKHTVKELKDLLKAAELPVTGKKQELIDRLLEAGYQNI